MMGLLVSILSCVFTMKQSSYLCGFAPQDGNQAVPINGRSLFQPSQLRQCGKQILKAHRGIHPYACGEAKTRGCPKYERDSSRTFVRFAFPEKIMVAEHFAVIRGEDDQPLPLQIAAALHEFPYQPVKLIVKVVDHTEVAGEGVPKPFALQVYSPGFNPRMKRRRLCPGADTGFS